MKWLMTDEEMYVVIGGAYDSDHFYNCLFDNPNEDNNNWLVLNLEGNEANKKAIGARVAITITEKGKERQIHRTVTSGSSFGANSLVLEVGLRKADKINRIVVQWPCTDCPEQEFSGMEVNKTYKLIQGMKSPNELEYNAVDPGGKTMKHKMNS